MPKTYLYGSPEYKYALKWKELTEDDTIELKSGRKRPPNTQNEKKIIEQGKEIIRITARKEREKELKKAEESKSAEELTLPKPLKVVKDIEPVVTRLKDDLEEFQKIGGDTETRFENDNLVIVFTYFAILKKFKSECPIFYGPNMARMTGLIVDGNREKTRILNDPKELRSFRDLLKSCSKRKNDVIPIMLYILDDSKEFGHANMLIYRPGQNIVERFEPHGAKMKTKLKSIDDSVNEQVTEIFGRFEVRPFLYEKINYVPPNEVCPFVKGFQAIESMLKTIDSGYCTMWSMFLMEMVLYNPNVTTSKIIKDIMDISKGQPEYLKNVIRGYVAGTEDLISDTLEEMEKGGFSYAYLSQRKAKGKQSKITNEVVALLGELLEKEKKGRRDDFFLENRNDEVALKWYDSGQNISLEEFRIKEKEKKIKEIEEQQQRLDYFDKKQQAFDDAGRPARYKFFSEWYDEQNKKGKPRETFESYMERVYGQQVKKSEPVHKPEPVKKSQSRKLL